MIRKKNIVLYSLVVVMSFFVLLSPIHADQSGDVLVGYMPDYDKLPKYALRVQIFGGGSVYDDTGRVKTNAVYLLCHHEKKTFRLVPNSKEKLLRVEYDGKDITSRVKGNMITIENQNYSTTLKIYYSINGVSTGDQSMPMFYILLLVGSLSIIVIGVVKRRKEKD
ncbi:MAG: hypothetical protein K2P09_05215 [Erysipelotrichales bacterium]|nr:hypothetical protein [Erysipelotrichales bacterium]